MLRRMLAAVMIVSTVLGVTRLARATAVDSEVETPEATPPRLSYAAGSVSFWRPGGDDWAPAQVNTPLAAGDELYTASDGNLELQIGGRAYVRAWGDTQLGLAGHEPHFLQLRVAAGYVVLDLGSLEAGDVVEVDTPGAAFTIAQPGYYRVDVTGERSSFTARRGGQATMTTAAGPAPAIVAGEAVVVEGGAVQRHAAAEADVWDRWNDARTAALAAPVSTQYVPAQVYGTSELDRHGAWRSHAAYGAVWVPAGVAPGWAPYSTGRWIWDPRFGWTWLDDAPWGWAPYHYGRWVSLGGVWAWAPGPIVVRPAYAPALVAFFGTPTVGVQVVGPSIGWVALGWGEPVVPWWGRPHFVGRPWWGGWGGPRARNVTVYRNVTVVNAVVSVRADHFGRRAVQQARIARPDVRRLQPVRGRLDVTPERESFRGREGRAQRPPDEHLSRRVVSTRPAPPRPEPPRRGDDRRDGRPDARPNERREARPEQRREPRPGVSRDVRPDPGREAERARRPATARPESPRVAPSQPEAGRVAPPRVDRRRPDVPRAEPPRAEPRRPGIPGAESPRVGAPRPEPGRVAPPQAEPRRPETPRGDSPRGEGRRPEVTRGAPPRVETPRPETPRPEMPRPAPPRVETPRPEMRVAPRRPDAPRVEPPPGQPRRPEGPRGEPRGDLQRPGVQRVAPPRAETRRPEPPRRAVTPSPRPEAARPAVQRRPEAVQRAPQARPRPEGREDRGGGQERGERRGDRGGGR